MLISVCSLTTEYIGTSRFKFGTWYTQFVGVMEFISTNLWLISCPCMLQVPFGDTEYVRNWLGIEGEVGKPACEHPKRTIVGLSCPRKDVRGVELFLRSALLAYREPSCLHGQVDSTRGSYAICSNPTGYFAYCLSSNCRKNCSAFSFVTLPSWFQPS